MNAAFKSDRLKIRLIEFTGYEFVRDGEVAEPWIRNHIADPGRRGKIERFKKLMLSGRWLGAREACGAAGGSRGLLNITPRKSPVLLFLPDGRPWEGKHRISAVTELRGRIEPLEFACILGWPGSSGIDRSKYVRSRASSVYNFNAVKSLVSNGFRPVELPPIVFPAGNGRRVG